MRISGFGSRQTKFLTLDSRNMSCQGNYLVRVGIGRSDCSHETYSPFHAIPKVPRIINISAVVVMAVDEGIDDTHYHDSILKAP